MATKAFYLANDNVLQCTVEDEDGAADTGATVTAVTLDSADANVETGLTLTHDATGTYEVTLDEDQYTEGAEYTARITVVGSNNEDGSIDLAFKVMRRTA